MTSVLENRNILQKQNKKTKYTKKQLTAIQSKFKTSIKQLRGEKLLKSCVTYLDWLKKNTNLTKLQLKEIYENCTRTLFSDKSLFNDIRFLRIWISYADYTQDATQIFKFLRKQKIGTTHSLFYVAFAIVLEKNDQIPLAKRIYQEGIGASAQPKDWLQSKYQSFLKRNQLSNDSDEENSSESDSSNISNNEESESIDNFDDEEDGTESGSESESESESEGESEGESGSENENTNETGSDLESNSDNGLETDLDSDSDTQNVSFKSLKNNILSLDSDKKKKSLNVQKKNKRKVLAPITQKPIKDPLHGQTTKNDQDQDPEIGKWKNNQMSPFSETGSETTTELCFDQDVDPISKIDNENTTLQFGLPNHVSRKLAFLYNSNTSPSDFSSNSTEKDTKNKTKSKESQLNLNSGNELESDYESDDNNSYSDSDSEQVTGSEYDSDLDSDSNNNANSSFQFSIYTDN
ncbi:mitotic checkpoint serine/threonine-protein kinase bub1 [Anaeramoeba flamelloides]|uniref:Mitotic checkpoint serine/threonine-protein kinase bub1 n=1 Tax=Anaeramoeba flamelloides TaxID=1746091 RepID=A0AAV7Z974_9EUKA|nr:mitotic checkpoint serine/threonine-protein kinase bub1 [Anaeramoeba flamelloides]